MKRSALEFCISSTSAAQEHMCLEATLLHNGDTERFHHHRKHCWTTQFSDMRELFLPPVKPL